MISYVRLRKVFFCGKSHDLVVNAFGCHSPFRTRWRSLGLHRISSDDAPRSGLQSFSTGVVLVVGAGWLQSRVMKRGPKGGLTCAVDCLCVGGIGREVHEMKTFIQLLHSPLPLSFDEGSSR